MTWATLRLCAIHLAANALLLWLGYEWLGVGESTGLRLVMSALDALAILGLVCWLYGATFVYFRSTERRLNEAFRTALRHIVPLLLAAICIIAVYGLLVWLAGAAVQPAFKTASYLTLKLQKPVRPSAVLAGLRALIWILRWIILPVAVLPMLGAIATRGWRGFGEIGWRAGWRYWLAVPALLLAGLMLPALILAWIPRGSFAIELASFSLRALVAYLLMVGSLVALTRVARP